MTDIVEYALPLDLLGEVFESRRCKVAEILGAF